MVELIDAKVVLAVINNHRYIPNYFFTSILNLLTYTKRYFKNVDIINICAYDVPVMRNIACDIAIKSGYDFIFMVDVDMDYPNDCVLRLYQRLLYLDNKDAIVVGSARTRSPPHKPTQFLKLMKGKDFGADENRVTTTRDSNELIKIEGTGLVGALIPIYVLNKMQKPYFENIYNDGSYMGEDINFAWKCKENNIDIYLDPQVTYGHELVKMIDADGERLVTPQ